MTNNQARDKDKFLNNEYPEHEKGQRLRSLQWCIWYHLFGFQNCFTQASRDLCNDLPKIRR